MLAQQQKFHKAARALLLAVQPCRQHAGIVEHEKVTGPQERPQVIEMMMGYRARIPVHGHHAGGIAGLGRVLGDQFFGKVIVKIRFFHGFTLFYFVFAVLFLSFFSVAAFRTPDHEFF